MARVLIAVLAAQHLSAALPEQAGTARRKPFLNGAAHRRLESVGITGTFIDDEVYVSYQDEVNFATGGQYGSAQNAYAKNGESLEGIYAGLALALFQLSVPSTDATSYFFNFRDDEFPRLKLVEAYDIKSEDSPQPELSTTDAENGACLANSGYVVGGNKVNNVFAQSNGAKAGFPSTSLSLALIRAEDEDSNAAEVTFRMGGTYKVCYGHDGSWESPKVDIPNVKIVVDGVYDSCTGDSCLGNKRHDCYSVPLRHNHNSSCALDYSGTGSGYEGDVIGKISWSEDYNATFDADGNVVSVGDAACSTSPSSILCDSSGACDGTGRWPNILAPAANDAKSLSQELPRVVRTLQGDSYRPYTVRVCYCPNYANQLDATACNSAAEFRQPIGVVHFWAVRICPFNDPVCVGSYFSGVVPQTKFFLRIDCPVDMCRKGNWSRLKLADTDTTVDEIPSSSPNHACRTAQETLKVEHVCLGDSCRLIGGEKQQYKLFGRLHSNDTNKIGDTSLSFSVKQGDTQHERLNFRTRRKIDVCFCEDDCTHSQATDCCADKWFKAGELMITPFLPMKSLNGTYPFLEYVNSPGYLGFRYGEEDPLVSGMEEGGLLKLRRTPDPDLGETYKVLTDADCAAPWDENLAPHLTQETAASMYRTNVQSLEPGHLGFNSAVNFTTAVEPNLHTVTEPGLIALCYCSEVHNDGGYLDGQCRSDDLWKLALLTTVKGGTPRHVWEFSTNVVFRFDLKGWGLTSDNSLRVLQSGEDCHANNRNPYKLETTMYKGCPEACSLMSDEPVNIPDIKVLTKAWDAVNCDTQNTRCEKSFIRKVVVESEFRTRLEFTAVPGLINGDRIVLTENFICVDCEEDALPALKGEYAFGTPQTAQRIKGLPFAENYLSGHVVTAVEGTSTMFTIPIGWRNPPKFLVVEVGPESGKWRGTSVAQSRLELRGYRAREALPVCWKFAPTGSFTHQVGILRLSDPTVMDQPMVAFSSRMLGQRAPIIISFRTAAATVGARYKIRTTEPMMLRLSFLNTDVLDVYLSDLETSDVETVNPGEDELREAQQYVCGKLFKELYSDDKENGFPMPKGCFFTTVGRQRELMLVFEPMSGLKPGHQYQLVLNGAAKTGIDKDGIYLNIFTMDEVYSKPYTAIEMGRAQLLRLPTRGAGAADPKMQRPEGFKILAETNAMDLDGTNKLRFELRGDVTEMAAIIPKSILRVFLWPLTQWDTKFCSATCRPYGDLTCGIVKECMTEQTAANGQLNTVVLILPDEMDPIFKDVKHEFVINEIEYPDGGFFPNRLAAEISRPLSDTKPHYMLSSGSYVMKKPNDGFTVAMLLDASGNGNHRPFRGSEQNELYLRLVFASTLSGLGAAYAVSSFTVTLPEGYEVIRMEAAEASLPAFLANRPAGRGTLGYPEMWELNGRVCTYYFKSTEIVYAGSSIVVKAVVKNPPGPIIQDTVANSWTLSTNSKGWDLASQWGYTTPTIQFTAEQTDYSASIAVLGAISDFSIQSSYAIRSSLQTDMWSTLSVYFKTEVSTNAGARVLLHAPVGYHFGRTCRIVEQPASYFSTNYGQVEEILEVESCIGHKSASNRPSLYGLQVRQDEEKTNQAVIDARLRLLADTRYAFAVMVVNPTEAMLEDNTWYLWTMTPKGDYIGGTPLDLRFNPTTGERIQLYDRWLYPDVAPSREGVVNYRMELLDNTPFNASGTYTYFRLAGLNVPNTVETTLRVTAPIGYRWKMEDLKDFKFCRAESTDLPATSGCKMIFNVSDAHGAIEDVTAHFPSIKPDALGVDTFPTAVDNVLYFPSGVYRNNDTYGFEAAVYVPAYRPLSSWNEFSLEFGYDQAVKPYFAHYPAPGTKAITSFSMKPDTVVTGMYTNLTVTFDTKTQIPPGGGLLFTAPDNFVLEYEKEVAMYPLPPTFVDTTVARNTHKATGLVLPLAPVVETAQSPITRVKRKARAEVEASSGRSLPVSVTCTATDRRDPGLPKLTCRAGADGIPPGQYAFLLTVQNPVDPYRNEKDYILGTPCGMLYCWVLQALRDIENPDGGEVDMRAFIAGYDLNVRMYAAYIVAVNREQRLATGRNDRPDSENNIVVAFTLSKDVNQHDVMHLEGPTGLQFEEDCFYRLEFREMNVFGEGVPLLPEFIPWNEDSAITGCIARRNVAAIAIKRGLRKESTYVFRIRIRANMPLQPQRNMWKLTFNSEQSQPFKGYDLWTFSDTQLRPVTIAKNLNEEEALPLGLTLLDTPNTLAISFRPTTTVSRKIPANSGALIRLRGPRQFRFADPCVAQVVQEETKIEDKQTGLMHTVEQVIWTGSDLSCFVREHNLLDVRINNPDRVLHAQRPYQLLAVVLNPATVQDQEGWWKLETFSEDSAVSWSGLDEVNVLGFHVGRVMAIWNYRNLDTWGLPMVYGRTKVDGLQFVVRFPDRVDPNDVISIEAPASFSLQQPGSTPDAEGSYLCNNFRWDETNAVQYITVPRCRGNLLRVTVAEVKPIPVLQQVKMLIDTYNPPVTDMISQNYWTCAHFRVDPVTTELTAMSTHTAPSWNIISQLEDVSVRLISAQRRAGGVGEIEVRFRPMSEANRVFFGAREPARFDFREATLILVGQEVMLLNKESLLMRSNIEALRMVRIVISNVVLGFPGGQTVFDIQTFLESQVVDEKLRFRTGFVLPGAIKVITSDLKSEYSRDPTKYPLKSQWIPQMSTKPVGSVPGVYKSAIANFVLQPSQEIAVNGTFTIDATPFVIRGDEFELTLLDGKGGFESIDLYGLDIDGSVLTGNVSMDIPASSQLNLTLDLLTPFTTDDMGWLFETTAEGDELPTNTNDGLFADFQLVHEAHARVVPAVCLICARHSPPGAIIDVSFGINSRGTLPNFIYIFAPLGFKILMYQDSCISRPSLDIDTCTVLTKPIDGAGGRSTALLTSKVGLRDTEQFSIFVATPYGTPMDPAWVVDLRKTVFDEASDNVEATKVVQVAWVENSVGFEIVQMTHTSVQVPPIPGAVVAAGVGFHTRTRLERSSSLTVSFPQKYVPLCDTFVRMTLPAKVSCRLNPVIEGQEDYSSITLQFNQTLPVADYSFLVDVFLPSMTPKDKDERSFSLVLRDGTGEVNDAAMNLGVPRMRFGVPLNVHRTPYWQGNPTCIRNCAGRKEVTIVFNVEGELEHDVFLKYIAIRFPPGAAHEIKSNKTKDLADVKTSFNYRMVDETLLDRFGFWLDEESWQLPAGEYDITLPVVIPDYAPGFNLWTVFFCSDMCFSEKDESVILAFSVAGFTVDDASPERAGEGSLAAALAIAPLLLFW